MPIRERSTGERVCIALGHTKGIAEHGHRRIHLEGMRMQIRGISSGWWMISRRRNINNNTINHHHLGHTLEGQRMDTPDTPCRGVQSSFLCFPPSFVSFVHCLFYLFASAFRISQSIHPRICFSTHPRPLIVASTYIQAHIPSRRFHHRTSVLHPILLSLLFLSLSL